MDVYDGGLGALGVGNLPFSSISPSTSLGTAQVSREPLPTIVGNATAMSIITSDGALATPIVINSIAAGLLPDNSSSEFLPSVSSNFTAQESPAIFIRTVLDTPGLARSGDEIITSAPTGATPTPETTVIVDSSIPRITIETVRISTTSETTTSDNERASTDSSQSLPFSTQVSPGSEPTTLGWRYNGDVADTSVIRSDESDVTTDVPAPFSSLINGGG
ncbi:hypothetical protein GGR58DRAFT_504099 [Xylaria digitata]|nr:hypothetical protein GGR58DRAFT_504099 [Xylaria digitata]